MRFRLHTLLIVLALGPPTLGFVSLVVPNSSILAALIVMWSVAFFTSVTSEQRGAKHLGLTIAEWLVIFAIAACVFGLLLPGKWPGERA